MAKRIIGTTPKQDGYRMPAEFEPQQGVWMLWPERNDNWRDGGKPAQKAFADVAKAIAKFEKVTVGASVRQYQNARAKLPENIRVVELESDDAWVRDCGPTFLVNDKGGLRAVDWEFNAWGGLVDGLYFPWDKDDQIARKICEIADVDSYRTEGFVLEGGSIHVDGEGTVLTREGAVDQGRHRPRRDERAHRRRGVLRRTRRGRLHLDGGQEPSVLRAGAGGIQIPERGDGRQGPQTEGAQALPDAAAVSA